MVVCREWRSQARFRHLRGLPLREFAKAAGLQAPARGVQCQTSERPGTSWASRCPGHPCQRGCRELARTTAACRIRRSCAAQPCSRSARRHRGTGLERLPFAREMGDLPAGELGGGWHRLWVLAGQPQAQASKRRSRAYQVESAKNLAANASAEVQAGELSMLSTGGELSTSAGCASHARLYRPPWSSAPPEPQGPATSSRDVRPGPAELSRCRRGLKAASSRAALCRPLLTRHGKCVARGLILHSDGELLLAWTCGPRVKICRGVCLRSAAPHAQHGGLQVHKHRAHPA